MVSEEFELEMSPLCQDLTDGEKAVRVEIYRGGGSGWHLEVVDEFGNSTVWEDQFSTDVAALEEAKSAIRDEGITALIGIPFQS
jgi:hypothetical protein